MRMLTLQAYTPTQFLRLGLIILVLTNSFGWPFRASLPAQTHSVGPVVTSNTAPSTFKVKPNTNTSQLQFGSSSYTATEGMIGTLITVNRLGSNTGAVSATIVMTDVTTSPTDYEFPPRIGTLDSTFNNAVTGSNNYVWGVAVQPDGKVMIGGAFIAYNNIPRKYLARLNSDDTLDTGFNSGGSGPNDGILGIAVQTNGKILIGGHFSSYNGVSTQNLAQLNPDGTLDATFDPARVGPNSTVRGIALQADGKIIISGDFTAYNGISVSKLCRLNPDGTLDTTFNSGTGPDRYIYGLTVQADGKIIVGGDFTTYNNTPSRFLARLNADGTLDSTFTSANFSPNPVVVYGVTTQPSDSKIIIGGYFDSYNGNALHNQARLNSDGTFDTTFTAASAGPNNFVNGVAMQSNNTILVVGGFTSYNGTPTTRIVRINANGTLLNNFGSSGSGPDGSVFGVAVQADGKILIAGYFTSYNGVPVPNLARLNSNGVLDTTFNSGGTGPNSFAHGVAVQTDGKILIAGGFTSYNGVARRYLARLNSDGTLDTTFIPAGTGPDSPVVGMTAQVDGKIIIVSNFTFYNGVARNYLARLNSDGTLDNSFAPIGSGFDNPIAKAVVQTDGKILVGGNFTSYNGTPSNYLSRLNSDGTLDTTFNSGGVGPDAYLRGLAVQADGKIVITGGFNSYNGIPHKFLARLNSDGKLDTAFTPVGSGPDSTTEGVAIQTDGKIIIGGYFFSYNGTPSKYLARITGQDGIMFSWLDGDSSSRSFLITSTNDTLSEPTETAVLGLTNLQGDASAVSPITATFTIVDNDPGQLKVAGGNSQTTTVNTTFTQLFTALVLTQAGDPVSNLGVTFTAPTDGPSGTFVSGLNTYSGTTDATGFVTTTTFTANSLAGSYTVSASVTSVTNPVNFVLTNTLASSSITLTSTPNPSLSGQNVTLIATVSPLAATGTVTFTEGTSVIGMASLTNGSAVYTTSNLSLGNHMINAIFGGNSTYAGATSITITQIVQAGCQPFVVTSIMDDGTGTNCGTLSFALSQPLTSTTSITISFALTQGNTITFGGSLTTSAGLKAYTTLDGGVNGINPFIVINGNGVTGDGLHLTGHNILRNVTIKGFVGRQLVTDGSSNRLQGVRIIHN